MFYNISTFPYAVTGCVQCILRTLFFAYTAKCSFLFLYNISLYSTSFLSITKILLSNLTFYEKKILIKQQKQNYYFCTGCPKSKDPSPAVLEDRIRIQLFLEKLKIFLSTFLPLGGKFYLYFHVLSQITNIYELKNKCSLDKSI